MIHCKQFDFSSGVTSIQVNLINDFISENPNIRIINIEHAYQGHGSEPKLLLWYEQNDNKTLTLRIDHPNESNTFKFD